MPTVKYATDPQVREAIERWCGNVTAAADELGIQPKNLRKRLETLGIDLLAVRARKGAMGAIATASMSPTDPAGPRGVRATPPAPVLATGRQTRAGLSRSREEAPIFPSVQTAETDADQDESPVKGVRVRPKPLRLQPAFQDDLRNAKLDLGARYRIETDENVILNQFFAEAFKPWIASKLEPTPTPPKKARNGKGEGGDR